MDPKTGETQALNLPFANYAWPRISPDDTRLTFGKEDEKPARVWIAYSSGSSGLQRLTSGSDNNRFPIFTSDGQYVAFQSDRNDRLGIFRQRVDNVGDVEPLTTPEPGTAHVPDSWYGNTLLFDVHKGADWSVWTVSLTDKTPRPSQTSNRRRKPTPCSHATDAGWPTPAPRASRRRSTWCRSPPDAPRTSFGRKAPTHRSSRAFHRT